MSSKSYGEKKRKNTAVVIGLVLAIGVGLAAIAMMAANRKAEPVNATPTPLAIESISQSLEPFRGKVVILDLWATWCGPCRMEIPDFIALQNKYHSQGLEIVGVSIDPLDPRGGGAAAVAPFVKQYQINYTIWMVSKPDALAGYPMGQGIPTTYVLDRNGRIARTYVGVRPMSVFENDIKALL